MVKVSANDLVAILRRFDYADDQTVTREVDQIRFIHPQPHNTLVAFRFKRHLFYVLFDDSISDDTALALEQIHADRAEVKGEFARNPHDHLTTYALPFKGKDVYLFEQVPDKVRLDSLLAERFPDTSRSTWQKHIKAGHISVNGVTVTTPKQDISSSDHIAVNTPEASNFSDHSLPILYIDDNVIVINKPVGVLTHAKGALNDEFTVAEFFRRYTTFGLEGNRPGIVHRLDRDTSGVMIGARTPQAAEYLQKQFADRKAKKTYVAILDGILKEPTAKIDLPIARSPSAPSTFKVDAKGKYAITEYHTEKTAGKYSLVELRPLTGRTHQLRVHMQYLGTPIHGDRVYGKAADRLYLHAQSLEITVPDGERMTFTAPLPKEFTDFFEKL